MSTSPYYTKTQVDVKIDDLEQQISNVADGTAGKAYPNLTTAMAVDPLPEDGVIFTIDEDNETESGVYAYDSNEVNGYRFVRELGANGKVEEGNTQAVSGGEVYDSAVNLFESNIPNPLSLINPYYRYTGGIKTTYTDNEDQTLSNGELTFNVATIGTVGRVFQLPTQIESDDNLWYDFTIKRIQESTTGSGVGFDNFFIARYTGGGIRKITINPDTNSYSLDILLPSANSYPLNLNDIVSYRVINGTIEVYVNGVKDYTYEITETITNNNVVFGSYGHPYITIKSYKKNTEFKDVLKTFVESNQTRGESNYFEKIGDSFFFYAHLKENLYIRYEIIHAVDMSPLVYVDYWRLRSAILMRFNENGNFDNTGLWALTGGENEAVYRKSGGVDDATGGYHGDEILTDISFYTDKGLIDHSEVNIPLTKCNEFFYIENSTMHSTATEGVPVAGHPIEALHLKRTSFDSNGYKTFNRVTWQMPITVSHWNIGISCISKDFAKFVCTNELFSYEKMNGSNEFKLETNNDIYSEYYGYNTPNELSVFATSKLLRGDIPQTPSNPYEFFVWDRSVDSKYYTRTPRKTVEVGEVWESEMEVKFK